MGTGAGAEVDDSVLTGVEIVVGAGKVDVSKVAGGNVVFLGVGLVGGEVVGDEVVVGIESNVVEVVVDGMDKVVLGVFVGP